MDRQDLTNARLGSLFLLGCLLLLPPILLVLDRPHRVFGIPVLYLYVFLAWGAIIALAAVASRAIRTDEANRDAHGDNTHPERRHD